MIEIPVISYETINKESLHKPVVRMLEDLILHCTLKPGEHLVEAKISESLGVSRGPVREAIAELETKGLVERVPFKGAVVSTLTAKDIEELKSCRMSIEILAAKLIIADEKCKKEAIQVLYEILNQMDAAAKEKDRSEFLMLDFDFHNKLVLLTANSLLQEMWKPISLRLRRYMYLNINQVYIPLNEAVLQHTAIIEAISNGDFDNAEELLKTHKCWS